MKNTVKKILALVFVVAMVCSLAVPAFAAEFEPIKVDVIVVDPDGDATVIDEIAIDKAAKANVLDALKAADADKDEGANIKFSFKNNLLSAVFASDTATTSIDTDDVFETSSWVVSVNGKAVNGDLATATLADDDVIVVYWADSTIGTKLIAVDDSAIAQGIVSFYYYDAEGNQLPLVGAKVEIKDADEVALLNKLDPTCYDNETGKANEWSDEFVTDEKGQIWLAPDYLDVSENGEVVYTIDSLKLAKELPSLRLIDGYTKAEQAYYDLYKDTVLVDDLVLHTPIVVEKDMYNVAGATGDMTIVYVLVAAAAVVTLGAVVVMKKKAVKAN